MVPSSSLEDGDGKKVDPKTVVDGVFLARRSQWDQGTVWWDDTQGGGKTYITVHLGAVYEIKSFVIQADNNDEYLLYYWDLTDDTWRLAWRILRILDWGMYTRPNPYDDSARYDLPSPVITNALKLEGDMTLSDWRFSVSEIQAFGERVEECHED